MTSIDNITTIFPDRFGIKDMLRQGRLQNPEFLDLTLMSYDILNSLKSQELSISKSLRTNENVSIFDHQILAAQKIKNELGGSAILADEVGLGKTVEAGILIKEFLVTGLAKKILILAPPSLLPQWQDEMRSKFDMDFVIFRDDSRFRNIASHDLLLMSHSSAVSPKQSLHLNAVSWDLVIVDEAHSMKNAETLKHRLVRNLTRHNLLLLTATPVQNNLEELFNLVDIMHPGYLGTWKQFQDTYVTGKHSSMVHPALRDQLQEILSKLIIRTTRKEVSKYIKFTNRIPHTHILKPTDDESELYNTVTDIVRTQYAQKGNTFALIIYQRLATSSTEASKRALYKMKMNGLITDARYQELLTLAERITIDSKIARLLHIMQGNKSKFLIFTEFHATQDYVAEHMRKNGYSVTLFHGKMDKEERKESVKKFKTDTQVMISTSAGGEGQNFQFCHNIVNYDLPWNPMKIEQRVGRVHRIGQTDDVQIFNFALENTIEAYILELLYMKINLFKMTLGDMDLLFEDSWSGGTSHAWFKAYMDEKTEQDRKNTFSALGNKWKSRKKSVGDAIQEFNSNVFTNFDLSAIQKDSSIVHEDTGQESIQDKIQDLVLGFFNVTGSKVSENGGLYEIKIPKKYSTFFDSDVVLIAFDEETSSRHDCDLVVPGSKILLNIVDICSTKGPITVKDYGDRVVIRYWFFIRFSGISKLTINDHVDVEIIPPRQRGIHESDRHILLNWLSPADVTYTYSQALGKLQDRHHGKKIDFIEKANRKFRKDLEMIVNRHEKQMRELDDVIRKKEESKQDHDVREYRFKIAERMSDLEKEKILMFETLQKRHQLTLEYGLVACEVLYPRLANIDSK